MRCKQTVVITGAGGRLGQVMVRRFEHRGDYVVPIFRHSEGGFAADFTDETAVSKLFKTVVQATSTIDVVVHTVGMWAQWPLLDTSLQDFERILRINLTSTFLCFREAVRHMHGRGGTIIGISAQPGVGKAGAQGGAYGASKAGLTRLVEAVAAEHPTVTCFALAPSYILYGNEPDQTRGVTASELADLAIDLTQSRTIPSGSTIKAFGTLA